MILSNLATVCRSSGLVVEEVAGWKTRGHGSFESIEAVVAHHTGTPLKLAGDYPTLKTVRDGRPGLDGPLSQLGLGRSGKVYVIAAGVAWHAGVVFEQWQNNWHAIGIEAEHDGVSAWPAVQYQAYVRLCRTLADAYDVPVSRVVGHKEIAKPLGRKPDPIFSMPQFRTDVARLGGTPGGTPTPPKEDEVDKAEVDDIVQGYALWARANELAIDLELAKARGDAVAVKVLTPRAAKMDADWRAHGAGK